jgi:hypothetical protein
MSNMQDNFPVFIGKDAPRRGSGDPHSWANRLLPLMQHPGKWALIYVCETPEAANRAQSNLHSRAVIIPEPKHTWEFAARWCEVYAVYRGKR